MKYTIIQITGGEMFNQVQEFKTEIAAKKYLMNLMECSKCSNFIMIDEKMNIYRTFLDTVVKTFGEMR